jgi:3-hydroxyisobutyrate dehydrogenase-like beta-hydroxyacid dehydrogenase
VTVIGFVGFGEVASRFAAAMHRQGAEVAAYDVVLDQSGGANILKERAGDTAVKFVALADLITRSKLVLSSVTTDVAFDVARGCAVHLKAGQIFVDLNATAPAVKRAIADVIEISGADFVEGAILGAIGVSGPHTRILVCGKKGVIVAETLTRFGLNAGFYGAEIGLASTFKLLRSVFSKGIEALLLESLLAARRAGVADDVWREILETLDERPFAEVGGNWICTHGRAHARRYHEMVQVKALLDELGIEPLITSATTAFFERSTRLALSKAFRNAPQNPDEVLAALDNCWAVQVPVLSRME